MWLSYKEIGGKVAAIRLSLPGKPSPQKFADLLGREGSVSTIRNIEHGCEPSWKNGPNEKLLRQIAKLGEVTLDHFRDGEVRDLERQEKLAVLRWLNRMTKDLQNEMGLTSPSVGDIVVDAQVASGRSNRGRGKKDGRCEPGGPGTEPGATIG